MHWLVRGCGLLMSALAILPLAAAAPSPLYPRSGWTSGDPSAGGQDPKLLQIIEGMTLEEKVGQLFVAYAYGGEADTADPDDVAANRQAYGVDNAAELIAEYHLGGIVYFDWAGNTGSNDPERIAALSNGLQEAALGQPGGIPLIISIDQEGGPVSRIGEPVTQFPDAAAIGAAEQPALAEEAAEVTARELRAMGINQNYAPVADVNVNPANPVIGSRSFGSDPQAAAEMTAAQVRGIQSAGVAATAKHFPGHGDTDVDSHTGVPVISHTRQEWQELDAPPFEAAIEAGTDSVMAGHLVFPELDPSRDPATLSEPVITGLLRDELGFEGVVVTDALDMEGVRDAYGDDRVPVLALQAGVDQLLQSPNGQFALQYQAVLDAVASGELTEERIEESVYRILVLKKRLGLFADPFAQESHAAEVVGSEANQEVARRIAEAARGG